MTMSQALVAISKSYVEGTVSYYGRLRPDPWEENITILENQMKKPELFGPPDVRRYCARALDLIQRFSREGSPARQITNADAMNFGSPEVLRQAESRVYRECRGCQSKGPLRPFKTNPTQIELLCEACARAEGKIK